MAILDSGDVAHPDLEVLLTTGEEVGLVGAKALPSGLLRGAALLSLDGESEGVFLTSCAGGSTIDLDLDLGERSPRAPAYELRLDGLAGGHSGLDIDKGRVNGIRALADLLAGVGDDAPVALSQWESPGAFNAINRRGRVVFAGGAGDVQARVEEWARELRRAERGAGGGDVRVELRRLDGQVDCLGAEASSRLLALLRGLPLGVVAMSPDVPGLVETSLNVGALTLTGARATVLASTRSSHRGRHEELRDRVGELAARHEARMRVYGEYPAWPFDPDNPLLELAVRVHRELFDREPEVTGVHGGLECGVLADASPQMAMLSIGAELSDCHTPRERASLSSVQRLADLTVAVVEAFG